LLLQFLDKLGDCHSVLLGVDGELFLHHSDLFWTWLLAWLEMKGIWPLRLPLRGCLRRHFSCCSICTECETSLLDFWYICLSRLK
jgi:hypothetical protein